MKVGGSKVKRIKRVGCTVVKCNDSAKRTSHTHTHTTYCETHIKVKESEKRTRNKTCTQSS